MSAASFTSNFLATSPMRKASGKTMGKTGQACAKVSQVDGRTLAERVSAFLRSQHPLKTAQCVEAETNISANTVRKWLEQGNAPSGSAYDALVCRYGADFLCAVHPEHAGAWFADVARQQRQQRLERKAAALLRQIDDLREGRA
ncbi:DNA-binding transcriptional regulator YiaG [Methylorubrum extorquens]